MRWGKFAASTLAVAVFVTAWDACAMSETGFGRARCSVTGGEKLLVGAGGSEALCKAVRDALAKSAPEANVSVTVRVLTSSMLAATLVVEDRVLPEQKFAVMDRKLDRSSIERFAGSIATKVAKATAP